MNKLEYLDLEYSSLRNKIKRVDENRKINCNIETHEEHNSQGTPTENFLIDLVINLGSKSEASWNTIEKIIRRIADSISEKSKILKENSDRLQSQIIILENLKRSIQKHKSLSMPEIIEAINQAKTFRKPSQTLVETKNLLTDLEKNMSKIFKKLDQSITHGEEIIKRLNSLTEKIDKIF